MFLGIVMFLIFVVCYIGQSISSGMSGKNGRLLQWGCWTVANVTMLLCYLAV